jgi:hypothetical protein
MEKKRNLYVIPTDKPSRLHITSKLMLYPNGLMPKSQGLCKNQHIYITSDEEIKEGNWYYDTNDNESLFPIYRRSQDPKFYSGCKKIILTTDQDLIADGVQAIDDEFLQWFVKNPSCEWVEIKMENYYASGALQPNLWQYKIIIPQEEPKQETLEEAAEKYWAKQPYNQDAFEEGAKWQAERMYSEEDMKECWNACFQFHKPAGFDSGINFNDFIEQFKKK